LTVVFSLLTSTRQAVFKLMGQGGGNVNFTQKKAIYLGSCLISNADMCMQQGGWL